MRITLPDGSLADGDDALSAWLERRVTLRCAEENVGSRYEDVVDFEREQSSDWTAFEGAPEPFTTPAARACRSSLQHDREVGQPQVPRQHAACRRGRGPALGSHIRIGEATLEIGSEIQRCVMVTRPQPGGIDRDLGVLRTIARERAACLAVGALVSHPGIARVGDELHTR